MKKTLIKSLVLAAVGSFCFVGSAMALPWDDLVANKGYVASTSMDYWTPTDLTTAVDGNSLFQLRIEQASYESSFGIYSATDSGAFDKSFEIFSQSAEPAGQFSPSLTSETLTFRDVAGLFEVTKTYSDDSIDTNDDWFELDSTFGFYFGVNQGYTFYTDSTLNSHEPGREHITTAYNKNNRDLFIFLDDQIGPNADRDFTDMIVFANDLQPVPEPTTMLLFGVGLVGLAGVARRNKSKK